MNRKENHPAHIESGMRLPPLQLEHAGEFVRLDAPELGALALLFVRSQFLREARACIESWEQKQSDLKFWLGRPFLISDGELPATQLPTALAPEAAWDKLGIGPDENALIITDRWSVVYVARRGAIADLLPVNEVEDWLRYLATQCPECGVIDEPGYGEWAP